MRLRYDKVIRKCITKRNVPEIMGKDIEKAVNAVMKNEMKLLLAAGLLGQSPSTVSY